MATITFTDGTIRKVRPMRALRLQFIQRGKMQGTPEIMKYLKKVKSIDFDTGVTPEPVIPPPQVRLPYVD